MGKFRRAVSLIASLFVLGGLAYCSYSFGSAEERMRQTCSEITPGLSASALRAFARKHGLNPPHQDSGVTFLAESRTFGRWSCRVTLDKGVVQRAEYNFAD